jgi:hypothetical protein
MASISNTVAPPAPFFELDQQFVIDLPGARALFTTRRGGHSSGSFQSLNIGFLTDDNPEAVRRNRALLAGRHGVKLSFVHQVHGREVVAARDDHHGAAGLPDLTDLPKADGQITTRPGLAPVSLTADCLPIAIAGAGGVGMLHGGWRGLRDGVIEAGVGALRDAGVQGELSAAIGPGAGPCCYQVGSEVLDTFADLPDDVRHGVDHVDLKAIARHALEANGVQTVHDIGLCTICSDPALLFSHRRDRGITGRQAGIAWLTGDRGQ